MLRPTGHGADGLLNDVWALGTEDQDAQRRSTYTWVGATGATALVSGDKPPAREGHSAAVLPPSEAGGHPRMVIYGGWDGYKALTDAWLFAVDYEKCEPQIAIDRGFSFAGTEGDPFESSGGCVPSHAKALPRQSETRRSGLSLIGRPMHWETRCAVLRCGEGPPSASPLLQFDSGQCGDSQILLGWVGWFIGRTVGSCLHFTVARRAAPRCAAQVRGLPGRRRRHPPVHFLGDQPHLRPEGAIRPRVPPDEACGGEHVLDYRRLPLRLRR